MLGWFQEADHFEDVHRDLTLNFCAKFGGYQISPGTLKTEVEADIDPGSRVTEMAQ